MQQLPIRTSTELQSNQPRRALIWDKALYKSKQFVLHQIPVLQHYFPISVIQQYFTNRTVVTRSGETRHQNPMRLSQQMRDTQQQQQRQQQWWETCCVVHDRTCLLARRLQQYVSLRVCVWRNRREACLTMKRTTFMIQQYLDHFSF